MSAPGGVPESVILLHDLGDPLGGEQWRACAPAAWTVPDLPGHGTTPAVRTGHYDPMAVIAITRWASGADATVIGVRRNAHSALVHAAGGGCARVAIVDGLWGPWRSAEQQIDAFYGMVRAIAADSGATAPAPETGLDPRARHGYGLFVSANFARYFWDAIDQPVLAIETPASSTPAAERSERLSWFGGPTELVELDTDDPRTIIDTVTAWR